MPTMPANTTYRLELTGKDSEGVISVITGNVRLASMSSDGWGGTSMELNFVPDSGGTTFSIIRPQIKGLSKHFPEGLC